MKPFNAQRSTIEYWMLRHKYQAAVLGFVSCWSAAIMPTRRRGSANDLTQVTFLDGSFQSCWTDTRGRCYFCNVSTKPIQS
jgi:hypothetical protein